MRVFSRSAMALAVAGLVMGPGAVLAHGHGQHRGDARQIQERLKDAGYDPGSIDGKMGPKTHAALKQFQQAQNLPATGRPDAKTLAALNVSGSGTSGTRGSERPGSEPEPGTGTQQHPGVQGVPGESSGMRGNPATGAGPPQ